MKTSKKLLESIEREWLPYRRTREIKPELHDRWKFNHKVLGKGSVRTDPTQENAKLEHFENNELNSNEMYSQANFSLRRPPNSQLLFTLSPFAVDEGRWKRKDDPISWSVPGTLESILASEGVWISFLLASVICAFGDGKETLIIPLDSVCRTRTSTGLLGAVSLCTDWQFSSSDNYRCNYKTC